jgi:hypothetical protein
MKKLLIAILFFNIALAHAGSDECKSKLTLDNLDQLIKNSNHLSPEINLVFSDLKEIPSSSADKANDKAIQCFAHLDLVNQKTNKKTDSLNIIYRISKDGAGKDIIQFDPIPN